jgi:hypothetical protein
MKRPSKEEFITYWSNLGELPFAERIKATATQYEVTVRCARMWTETLLNDIEETKEESYKSFDDWLEDYRDPLQEELVLHGKAELKTDALIVCLSDIHLGSHALMRKVFAAHKKLIEERKKVYFVFVGDMIDYGPRAPPGLDQRQAVNFKHQKEMALLLADDIGHKCLAVCAGCHSHFAYTVTGELIEEEFAKKTLFKNFLTNGGLLDLKVGTQDYTIFLSHKIKGSTRMNPSRGIIKLSEMDLDFDIGIEAHKHTPCITVMMRRQKPIYAINCGTFQHLTMYANKEGFIEQPYSIPGFFVSASSKMVIPFIDWREGLRLI